MSEKAVAAFVKSDIAMRFLDQLRYFLRIYYLVSCYIIIISFVFSFPIQFLAFPKLRILINLSYCNVEGFIFPLLENREWRESRDPIKTRENRVEKPAGRDFN